MDETIRYIIEFILGGTSYSQYADMVGYTSNKDEFSRYCIVIVPSGFFDKDLYGTVASIPSLPLDYVDGLPVLFGKDEKYYVGNTIVIKADIIASSYFFISRYEEYVCRAKRDVHGRFPGKESLLVRAGMIDSPLIDMYGKYLRQLLRDSGVSVDEPKEELGKVWLTHDVDAPFFCRSFRAVVRESLKGIGFPKAYSIFKGNLDKDPYYTFPWIIEKDNELCSKSDGKCSALYFLKVAGNSGFDKPYYDISFKDVRKMICQLKSGGALFGLHSSYKSGRTPDLVAGECLNISNRWSIGKIKYNRNHFLRSCEPENFRALINAGITDDFTMGYADVSGFRLATSRPVRWIDPETRCVTDLIMHPLLVMDCTLRDERYMGLPEDEAFEYCVRLISEARKYNGEVVLLWHNTSFVPGIGGEYHKPLYQKLLGILGKLL